MGKGLQGLMGRPPSRMSVWSLHGFPSKEKKHAMQLGDP